MAVEKLPFGTSLTGLLVDGVEETPYAGCTLRMVEPSGPLIEVPYIHYDDTKQFEPVQNWFSTRTPPPNMNLLTDEGTVSLFDIQWSGHAVKSGHNVSLGKLRPTEIVLSSRQADLASALLVAEMRSHIDGLKEWTRFTAIKHESETNEKGLVRKLVVEVESLTEMAWRQGEATMTLQTDWKSANPEGHDVGSFNIFEWVVLDSKFEEPRLFFEHLVEQRKIVHLLILIFGKGIRFRKHQVRDQAFAVKRGDGHGPHLPFVELISRRTVHEYAEKPPTREDLREPLFYLREMGTAGMQVWAEEYEKWKRFILPATAILGRSGVFVEDLVVSLSMALESAGSILGHCDGEEETYRGKVRTTSTYVYRCLQTLDLDWGDRVESTVGLARATANTYNGTKHFNDGVMPDNDQIFVISEVLRKVARLMTLHILNPSGELLKRSREEGSLWRIHDMLVENELRITHEGKWEHIPKPEQAKLPEGISFGL